MHRYAKRRELATPSLFDDNRDPEPKTPLKADAGIANAARVFLAHEFGRPFHYGVEALCDASNENAEIFLKYTGNLVAEVESRLIRRRSLALPADVQQGVLQDTAKWFIKHWAFPMATQVRTLVEGMADVCVAESLKPNAPLDAGANAIGVLEEDFAKIPPDSELLYVLKQAVAHGAVTIERDYKQGGDGKLWCLIELTGTVCLAAGLTFNRGGFVPKKTGFFDELLELNDA